jgi:hypothetical protein
MKPAIIANALQLAAFSTLIALVRIMRVTRRVQRGTTPIKKATHEKSRVAFGFSKN